MTSTIQKKVMRRVQIMRILDTLLTPTLLSVTVGMVSLWGVGREVWVARVFQNEPSFANLHAFLQFYLAAFSDTRHVVQVLVLIALGATLWLGISLVRQVRHLQAGNTFA